MRFFLLVCVLLLPKTLFAAPDAIGNVRYINENQLDEAAPFSDVLQAFNNDNNPPLWLENTSSALSLGFTDDIYWMRWPITPINASRSVFRIDNPSLDDLSIWFIDQNHSVISRHTVGAVEAFANREIDDVGFSFIIEPNTAYAIARIQTSSSYYVDAKVMTQKQFAEGRFTDAVIFGTFTGLIMVMLAYNIHLSLQSELRFMRIYCGWLLSLYFNQIAVTGHTLQYFWPNMPLFNHYIGLVSGLLIPFFSLWFMYELLELKNHLHQLLDKLYKIYTGLMLAAAIIVPFSGLKHPYDLSYLLIFAAIGIALSLSTWRVIAGDYRAVWLVIAWVTISIPGVIRSMMMIGQIEGSFLIDVSVFIGTGAETLLIGLLLASILLRAQKDELRDKNAVIAAKNKANHKLTKEINLQTKQLNHTNRQLFVNRYRDSLTRLPNYDYFQKKGKELLSKDDHSHRIYALLAIEIDTTMEINPRQRMAAEACKLLVSKRVKTHFKRFGNVLARYSDNGFTVLISNANLQDLQRQCEAFKTDLSQLSVDVEEYELRPSCSIAVEVFDSKPASNLSTIFDRCQALLHTIKKRGINQLEINM